jgi:hypothetical protein
VRTKFEGTATVNGTYQGQQVSGYAFLELVGNWSRWPPTTRSE